MVPQKYQFVRFIFHCLCDNVQNKCITMWIWKTWKTIAYSVLNPLFVEGSPGIECDNNNM